MTFELLGKKVAIKVDEEPKEKTTESGIILSVKPEETDNKVKTGEIVHIGQKCETGRQVGERVLFLGYQATTLDYEGVKYQLLDEDSILALVD